ncbi:hypothetical protein ARMGADRAFT_592430 [Armillaria gallica]|uniref:Uncharacterized protein n=1 Tax=Armillaria gallica TaxID=47427 RepID=A0A2H3CUK0_ARMGA|nr:hypothetical protein ARMGADRAFT_592430 [Armillaria gallica]
MTSRPDDGPSSRTTTRGLQYLAKVSSEDMYKILGQFLGTESPLLVVYAQVNYPSLSPRAMHDWLSTYCTSLRSSSYQGLSPMYVHGSQRFTLTTWVAHMRRESKRKRHGRTHRGSHFFLSTNHDCEHHSHANHQKEAREGRAWPGTWKGVTFGQPFGHCEGHRQGSEGSAPPPSRVFRATPGFFV